MQYGGFAGLLRAFADAVAADVKVRVVAWPEDQLKAPVSRLIEDATSSLGRTAACRTEVVAAGIQGRPDIGVAVDGLLTGFIELKAPGRGARPERFTGPDKVQWEKFRSIPNLVYTDGSEWSLHPASVPARSRRGPREPSGRCRRHRTAIPTRSPSTPRPVS